MKTAESTPEKALQKAFDAAGGREALSIKLGLSRAATYFWRQVPPLRVLEVERLTGVSRHELRPDLYPVE
jgi:DNA-binding transcriptional regulator YdaS (Cro superfamily)